MIDWTKPLELLNGTPVWLAATGFAGGPNPDEDGDYWVEGPDGYRECVGNASADCMVRNRIEPTDATAELACIELPEQPSIRDRFAMAAMALMMPGRGCSVSFERVAMDAYNLADAMMAERAK